MTTKEQVLEIFRDRLESLKNNEGWLFDTIIGVLELLKQRIETKVTEPQVKQLQWETIENVNGYYATAFKTEFRTYTYDIKERNSVFTIYFDLELIDSHISFESQDQAKAYAQKHFEGLIKSCLEE